MVTTRVLLTLIATFWLSSSCIWGANDEAQLQSHQSNLDKYGFSFAGKDSRSLASLCALESLLSAEMKKHLGTVKTFELLRDDLDEVRREMRRFPAPFGKGRCDKQCERQILPWNSSWNIEIPREIYKGKCARSLELEEICRAARRRSGGSRERAIQEWICARAEEAAKLAEAFRDKVMADKKTPWNQRLATESLEVRTFKLDECTDLDDQFIMRDALAKARKNAATILAYSMEDLNWAKESLAEESRKELERNYELDVSSSREAISGVRKNLEKILQDYLECASNRRMIV